MDLAPPLYASAPPCASATTYTLPPILHPGLTWARRADGLDACKTLRVDACGAWTSTPAPPARGPEMLRVAWMRPVADLGDLHAQLVAAQAHPDTHAVLAALRPDLGDVARQVRRDAQTFARSTSTRILCLDIDDAPLDPHLDVRGLASAVLWACGLDERAGCVWQWSASAGLKEGLRARLWCLLARPVAASALRGWLAHLRGEPTKGRPGAVPWADPSTYSASQPVYTAPPRIVGGADPYPVRLVLIDGAPLDPGPVEAWALRQAMRARIEAQEREARAAEARQRANGGCDATRRWLRDACAGLMATPPGGRHDALRAVLRGACEAVREARLGLVEAEAALVDAVQGWPTPARDAKWISSDLRRLS